MRTNSISNLGLNATNPPIVVTGTVEFVNDVAMDTCRARTANELTINDNVVITGNLTVNGSSNIGGGGGGNPFYIAGRVNADGTVPEGTGELHSNQSRNGCL